MTESGNSTLRGDGATVTSCVMTVEHAPFGSKNITSQNLCDVIIVVSCSEVRTPNESQRCTLRGSSGKLAFQ